MRRRDVVKLLAGAAIAAPYRVAAQTSAKTYRLATLAGGAAITADSPMGKTLTGALAERGYTLGQSLEIQAHIGQRDDTEHQAPTCDLTGCRNWHGTLPRARSMPSSSSAGRRPLR
jgi:hypothetical protein